MLKNSPRDPFESFGCCFKMGVKKKDNEVFISKRSMFDIPSRFPQAIRNS